MNTIKTLKEEIKKEAVELRNAKAELKEAQRAGSSSAWSLMSDLRIAKDNLRHRHVAYSLALGNTYEQIEPVVREGNEISWSEIERIQAAYGLLETKEVV